MFKFISMKFCLHNSSVRQQRNISVTAGDQRVAPAQRMINPPAGHEDTHPKNNKTQQNWIKTTWTWKSRFSSQFGFVTPGILCCMMFSLLKISLLNLLRRNICTNIVSGGLLFMRKTSLSALMASRLVTGHFGIGTRLKCSATPAAL